MKRLPLIILICSFFISLKSQNFSHELLTKQDFDVFSALPLSAKFGQSAAVKLVYDKRNEKMYFINANSYKYHYEFCLAEIDYYLDHEYFNYINYIDDPKRRFLLANLNYFPALDIYALELSPADQMSYDEFVFLNKEVAKSTFINEKLKLLLNTKRLQQAHKESEKNIPSLYPSEIYSNQSYQAIGKYSGNGRLRFIDNIEESEENLFPDDIIVIDEMPLVLPKVAGVIVKEFQTPLSHLSILAQNRQIPVAAYKNAFDDDCFREYQDSLVHLSISSDTFYVNYIDKLPKIKSKKRTKKIKLKYDLSKKSIIDIADINRKSNQFAGNKAANFGELKKLSKKAEFKTPENAFVIPFYAYSKHIQDNNINMLIDSLLDSREGMSNEILSSKLRKIRKEILSSEIDSSLIESINQKVITYKTYNKYRFRSSTNAEDAEGFSGAGLYRSKTGVLFNSNKSFEKAIKKVWASLWSYEAFTERAYFNIDHSSVYMGILVHRSFPDEEVNGVAITKNLYRPTSYGFLVNAQLGEESVVKPKKGIQCDQFICYPEDISTIYSNRNTIEIITKSSLNNGKLVMTDEEIQHLANQLEIIKKWYSKKIYTGKTYLQFGMDIEFKLDADTRDLYIKQARVFND